MKTFEKDKVQEFAMVMALAMLIVYFFIKSNLLIILGIIVLSIGVLLPLILFPFAYLWFKFGAALGKIVSPVILVLVYTLVLLPVALFRRLIHIDTLKLNRKKYHRYRSSFVDREHLYKEKDLKHTF
jgi:hypothetical protein